MATLVFEDVDINIQKFSDQDLNFGKMEPKFCHLPYICQVIFLSHGFLICKVGICKS